MKCGCCNNNTLTEYFCDVRLCFGCIDKYKRIKLLLEDVKKNANLDNTIERECFSCGKLFLLKEMVTTNNMIYRCQLCHYKLEKELKK